MIDHNMDTSTGKLEQRIEYLEEMNRWYLFALDTVASLGELHEHTVESRDPGRIFKTTRLRLQRFVPFYATAFLSVNESDSDFVITDAEPTSMTSLFQAEVDKQIANGNFAWALHQNRAVLTKPEAFGRMLILHVLATKVRVRGMFIGVLDKSVTAVPETKLKLISIILQNTSYVLESAQLYRLLSDQNLNLERIIRERTCALEHLAYHDVLTGLPNRLMLNDRLNQFLPLAQRYSQQMAVMFLDLDRFKMINETMGHQYGDVLLQDVAKRLSGCLRGEDTVARQGGDEFIIVLPRVNSIEDVKVVATKILTSLNEPFILDGNTISIGASIGISLYPKDGKDAATLTKHADIAMYNAKERGRNNYQFYDEGMQILP